MKSIIDYIYSRMLTESNENSRSIQGLDGYNEGEVCEMVQSDIETALNDAGFEDYEIIEIWLHGSRLRGDAKNNSDLDVVMFYKGSDREDDLFNTLHDSMYFDTEIEGIKVDVNPVRINNESDIKRYKEKSDKYDKEKLKK